MAISNVSPIVLDAGTGLFKLGIADDSFPRCVFPPLRATISSVCHIPGCTATWYGFHAVKAPEYMPKDSVDIGIQEGSGPESLELLAEILNAGCSSCGLPRIEKEGPPLVVACKPACNRKALSSVLFETLEVPSLALPSDVIAAAAFANVGQSNIPALVVDHGVSCTQYATVWNGALAMLCITQPLQIDALLAECSQDKHFSSTVPTPDPFVAHSPLNSYKPHVLRSLCRISKSKSELPKDMQTAGFWSPQVAVAAANDTACSESPLQDLPVHIRQQIFDSVLEHPPCRNQIGLCNEWLTSAGWTPNGQPIPFSQVFRLPNLPMWGSVESDIFESEVGTGRPDWTLHEKQVFTLADALFCGETIFTPSLRYGDDSSAPQQMITECYNYLHTRGIILKNVLLIGAQGSSLICGFSQRLFNEIKHLGCSITEPTERLSYTWRAVNTLAQAPQTSTTWLTKKEYEECGARALNSREKIWGASR